MNGLDPVLALALTIALAAVFVATVVAVNVRDWRPWIAVAPVPDTSWTVGGIADFSGDGSPDILWRNTATGANYLWIMNGPDAVSGAAMTPVPDTAWSVGGTADFDNDGDPDIFWRNTATGANYLWIMNGTVPLSGTLFPSAGTNWTVTDHE